MSKIYLATPYSHKDPAVRQARFEAVTKAAGELIAQGHHVFSPITHSHPIALAHPDMPTHHEYWRKFNESMIDWCDEVRVMPGWEESIGVTAEILYAWERETWVASLRGSVEDIPWILPLIRKAGDARRRWMEQCG